MRMWRLSSAIAAAALVLAGAVGPAHAAQKRGDLDTAWGDGGIATTSFPAAEFATTRDSLVQPDGKVVIVGTVGDNDYSTFAVARFTPDGRLDQSFSGDGMVQVGFQQAHAAARSVAIDSQGRLLITGVTSSPAVGLGLPDMRLALVRLLPNGVPDPAFGDLGNGRVRITFAGRMTQGWGITVASGDRPVVVGTELAGEVASMVLFRFTQAGQPDNSFSLNGHLPLLSGVGTEGSKVVMSGDVLYATGYRHIAVGTDQPVIAKVLDNGTPDLTFGPSGIRALAVQGASNYGVSIALPPTSPPRISIGASSYTQGTMTPLMVTTTIDGTLSADYGVAGVFTGTAEQELRDAEVAPDGSSLMVSVSPTDTMLVTAVRPDGTKDSDFAGGGSTSPLPGTVFHGRSVSLASDGNIFVGGNMVASVQMGLVRLHGTAIPGPSPTPPQSPALTGLAVKAKKVRVSITPQPDATVFNYSARKMKPDGTAGKVTASGDLEPGTTSIVVPTPGAMHGLHLSVTAAGPGGTSPPATLVWGRRTTGRIGTCKPVRITRATFSAKTRLSFAKRRTSCARVLIGDRSRVIRKGKTSTRVPAAGRVVFRAGKSRTAVVLG